MRMRLLRSLFTLVLALCLPACAYHAAQVGAPLTVTIAHVNDTHSALEPADENLVIDGSTVRAKLGGMARLKTALDDTRAHNANVLTLHAGDAVQGTLYFNVFQGLAEFDYLNALGFDAMVPGNHEFDKGPEQLGRMLATARFPVLAANIDATSEPALKGRFAPVLIRQFPSAKGGMERVAIIGVTTPSTPLVTSSVGQVRFLDPAESIKAQVRALKAQNINKVVVLSHNGYDADLDLARRVPGIDVIVGGHSHTLLGAETQFGPLGLAPRGPYPTRVEGPDGPVLVVQAWKWGEALGVITVRFDAAGHVQDFTAAPTLLPGTAFRLGGAPVDPASAEQTRILSALKASGVAHMYAEDPAMLQKLAPYAEKVAAVQNKPLGARAVVDLIRGTATDPGPLVADAYVAKVPGTRISLVGAGGLRRDLFAGDLTLGMVMSVCPFGNTLVAMDITGAQLKEALEQSVAFRLDVRPQHGGDLRRLMVVHPGGFSYVIHPQRPKGQRVDGLRLRLPGGGFAPLDVDATYRLVTNSFLAGGGDGLTILKSITANRIDTGYLEHDALADHLKHLGTVAAPEDPRAVIDIPAAAAPEASPSKAQTRRATLPWYGARGAGPACLAAFPCAQAAAATH